MQTNKLFLLAGGLLAGAAEATAAQMPPGARTYANPVDVDYRYNFEQSNEKISYRTGADPVIVPHGDAYYLFMTLADGYWRSTDLIDWRFVAPDRWPLNGMVAPAAASDGQRLLVMRATMAPEPVLVTTDPAHGHFDFLARLTPNLPKAVPAGGDRELPAWHNGDPEPERIAPGPWDPALFRDDDGRWYLYWGSFERFPLFGIEVDLSHGFAYLGDPRSLFALDPARHGWERFGRDHRDETHPAYIEGAWMTKHGGRYYLQYAAPGTEFNVYATGTYVADSPLGPFAYAPYNPVGYKPGGFVEGAGHGNTFQDKFGNWWNTGTPWIGVNWRFERRIGLWPAAFADDGQMRVDTRFGDFPHYMPEGRVDDPDRLFTGWMLLSYRKRATASSTFGNFTADAVTDENPRTFWVAADSAAGQTLTVDLGAVKTLRAVQVDFADYASERYADAPDIYTEFELESSLDGRKWSALARTEPPRRDRPNAYFQLPQPVRARYVRYQHGHVGAARLAISDLRVFGNAGGGAPAAPARVHARRTDPRAMRVRWRAVAGAVGYNVRWGLRPDRLDLCYQVFADRGTELEIRALNAGVAYNVAVEAFDENGVSKPSESVHVPANLH